MTIGSRDKVAIISSDGDFIVRKEVLCTAPSNANAALLIQLSSLLSCTCRLDLSRAHWLIWINIAFVQTKHYGDSVNGLGNVKVQCRYDSRGFNDVLHTTAPRARPIPVGDELLEVPENAKNPNINLHRDIERASLLFRRKSSAAWILTWGSLEQARRKYWKGEMQARLSRRDITMTRRKYCMRLKIGKTPKWRREKSVQ